MQTQHLPSFSTTASATRTLSGPGERNIVIGRLADISKRGKDLPSGRNVADYVLENGGFDMISFYEDHATEFPTARLIALKEASGSNVEVECGRFFSTAGFLSHPTRSRMGITTYERLAMLTVLLKTVYIDEDKVIEEYLRRQKGKDWDDYESKNDASFLVLEKEIAEAAGEEQDGDDEDD